MFNQNRAKNRIQQLPWQRHEMSK